MSPVPVDAALTEAEMLRAENQKLRERLAKLSEASVSIAEDLETEAVLQEVINSA